MTINSGLQIQIRLEMLSIFGKVSASLASGQKYSFVDRGFTTMTNEELTAERQRGWEAFTKVSTVSVVVIMAVLALMAATLI